MYEYVAVTVKIRVEHIAFRTVRDKTADISSDTATIVPKYVVWISRSIFTTIFVCERNKQSNKFRQKDRMLQQTNTLSNFSKTTHHSKT
jgi:hypothetical protein